MPRNRVKLIVLLISLAVQVQGYASVAAFCCTGFDAGEMQSPRGDGHGMQHEQHQVSDHFAHCSADVCIGCCACVMPALSYAVYHVNDLNSLSFIALHAIPIIEYVPDLSPRPPLT